jgi:hypothetical protein
LIGYFSAPSAKNRLEILRIIATVMDFSSEERRKSGVEESSSGLSGWATGLLKMTARSRTSSGNSSTGDAEKVFRYCWLIIGINTVCLITSISLLSRYRKHSLASWKQNQHVQAHPSYLLRRYLLHYYFHE